jgi:hypothetical protein
VLLRAHPRDQETGEEVDEDYEALVESLGVRCTVLEAEMKKRMDARGKLVTGGAGQLLLLSVMRYAKLIYKAPQHRHRLAHSPAESQIDPGSSTTSSTRTTIWGMSHCVPECSLCVRPYLLHRLQGCLQLTLQWV